MIAKDQKDIVVLQNSEEIESLKMSFDENSTQILMRMMSKNLYSDAIGSTIREVASNALDSHRRADVKEPILVSLEMSEGGAYEFSVEDFGVGLDANDVKNIISKYGKSTKRESANELGMFGLGFKAPLAYGSSFYFVCRKDGIERKYMMYEGETINTIDLLYEIETEHRNGVKVIIPVKPSDYYIFVAKIKKQLAYFEDVWFNVKSIDNKDLISNDFKIIREEDWQFSEISDDGYLHMCLDNVYYPLSTSELGIESIRFPVALRFNLEDGLYPIPNRESIRINEEVKGIILEKIEKVNNWFVNKYNSEGVELENFDQVVQFYSREGIFTNLGNKELEISSISKIFNRKLISPKLKGYEKINLKSIAKNKNSLFLEYKVTHELKNGSLRKTNNSLSFDSVKNKKVFVYENSFSGIFKEYVRDCNYNNVVFVRKANKIKLKDWRYGESYKDICKLHNYDKSEWRTVISEFQKISAYYTEKFIPATSESIPKDWLARRAENLKAKRENRKKKEREKQDGDISVRLARNLERHVDGKNCKFETDNISISKIMQSEGISIYDTYENEHKVDMLFSLCSHKRISRMFSVSKREIKKIQGVKLHNLFTVDEFMKGENKVFRKIVTADLIYYYLRENSSLSTYYSADILEKVSKEFTSDISALDKYAEENRSRASETARIAMLEIAEANNLFDREMYEKYLKVKELCDKIPVQHLLYNCTGGKNEYNTAITNVLIQLFKYNKIKVNIENYSNSNILEPVNSLEEAIEELEEEEVQEEFEKEQEDLEEDLGDDLESFDDLEEIEEEY